MLKIHSFKGKNGNGIECNAFEWGERNVRAKKLGVRRRAMLTMPQEAFDRAIFNTKLSETVLGFSLVQTWFPPEPGKNT